MLLLLLLAKSIKYSVCAPMLGAVIVVVLHEMYVCCARVQSRVRSHRVSACVLQPPYCEVAYTITYSLCVALGLGIVLSHDMFVCCAFVQSRARFQRVSAIVLVKSSISLL